ncbi:MAG: hypothetical protein K8R25_11705, partial [Methanosarcinales archaeon]|nr:hypothetical protein [Methanosarcinales archaeon]
TTSMYTGNDNISRISWLGQPCCVVDNNKENMHIARLLIDEDMDSDHLIGDGRILTLPEGFAITPYNFFENDDCQVDFLLTQNGKEKDRRTIKEDELYKYNLDINNSNQIENYILRFYLDTIFCGGMCTNPVKINSTRMISSNVQVINNNESFSFILDGSKISWLGQPYYVIDHDSTGLTAAELLIDDSIDHCYELKKGHTLFLPDGFAITVLETHPPIAACLSTNKTFNYGHFSFLLTQYGKKIDSRTVNSSECYEYRLDLNGSGKNDNWVLKFNAGDIFSDDYIWINSIKLISQDVLKIENINEMNIVLEGYKTNIENDGITLTVVRDNNNKNIQFSRDGTVSFMENWFTVRVNSASDAVAVSSVVIISDTYELVGAIEYLYSGYADVNLTSKDNPAILYYDLENAQGHETLNFSIDNNYDPPYVDDPYRIPVDSFVYTTRIYPTRDHNDLKIAWLGEPYMVIEQNSSTVIINKFLIDECRDDCYQLSMDNPLNLPYGFNLTASINNSNIAWFSLIKDGLEVYNTTAGERDLFQYKEDLNSNGINDNLVLSFTVESANKSKGSVIINSLGMISPESLMINDGDVDMLAAYTININNAKSAIEVRLNEDYIHNDIILKEDKLTGILNNTFLIRVNGAVEVIKLLNIEDTQQYEYELIKRRVNSIKKKMPDIMKNDKNRTDETTPDVPTDVPVPGFGLFMCTMILLIVRKKLRKN